MFINSISDLRKAARHGKYAWPGGYPTYWVCDDGASLCHDCFKSERRSIIDSVANKMRDGWRVVGYDINWEDDSLYCAHCDSPIESAYGDNE